VERRRKSAATSGGGESAGTVEDGRRQAGVAGKDPSQLSSPLYHFGFTVDELDRQAESWWRCRRRLAAGGRRSSTARRVHLDLTGRLPTPEASAAFIADTDPAKRAKLVDRLLETDDFSRHWAKYWRDVVFHNSTANRRRVDPALEDWFAEQFSKKVGWDRDCLELISATPKQKKGDRNEYGQDYGPNNFVLACNNDPGEIASQTARIFMGISIRLRRMPRPSVRPVEA
jgi:hypothetical protein